MTSSAHSSAPFASEVRIQRLLLRRHDRSQPQGYAYFPPFEAFARFVSDVGDLYGYVFLYLASTVIIVTSGHNDARERLYAYSHIYVWSYYAGERLKLLLKMPRPNAQANPDLVQDFKPRLFNQYGPPSTHVMGIVLCGYPLFDWIFGGSQSTWIGCFCLCLLVGLTRIYLGAHTVFCIVSATAYVMAVVTFYDQIGSCLRIVCDSWLLKLGHLALHVVHDSLYPEVHVVVAGDEKRTKMNERFKFDSKHDVVRIGLISVCALMQDLFVTSPTTLHRYIVAALASTGFYLTYLHDYHLVPIVAGLIQNLVPAILDQNFFKKVIP